MDKAKILQTKSANNLSEIKVNAAQKLGRMMKHKQRRLQKI
jgi:hypothetical protein